MSGYFEGLIADMTQWLSGRAAFKGVRFKGEYPFVSKDNPLRFVTVAVGLEQVSIGNASLGNYLGRGRGEESGEMMGKKAEIKLRLDIHAPLNRGGKACHDTYSALVEELVFNHSGFQVKSAGCGQIAANRETGSFLLTADMTVCLYISRHYGEERMCSVTLQHAAE